MRRHLLVLGGVSRIQAPAGWRGSGSGGDHAKWRAAGARVRQELGTVRGCSTHLREEKHNSRDVGEKSAEGTGLLAVFAQQWQEEA